MAKKKVQGLAARAVDWERCALCGRYYYPRNPKNMDEHASYHARAVGIMEALAEGWAFLIDEAEHRYALGGGRPRPMRGLEEGLRALDRASSVGEGPVRRVEGRLLGRADIMARLAAPYIEPLSKGAVAGYASDRVRAFPRWARLMHTGVFGAERFLALGWVKALEETTLAACGGPPYEPWRIPHAERGCQPRHLAQFIEWGYLDAIHQRTTPNCRRVVQGLVDYLGRPVRRPS